MGDNGKNRKTSSKKSDDGMDLSDTESDGRSECLLLDDVLVEERENNKKIQRN